MSVKECYHCRQKIPVGQPHDCWSTTEEKLTQDLPEDLRDAWERLRETAADFGEQRIYASHKSIMFSRKACYFFVRPKKKVLEICFFLGRTVKDPLVRQTHPTTKVKVSHLVHIVHRDQVEAPLTDWLREAFELQDTLRDKMAVVKKKPVRKKTVPKRQGAARGKPRKRKSG